MTGTVTISIDLELAWGNWDDSTAHQLAQVEQNERPISRRLVALFDRYDVPATWAFVAALLDPAAARGRSGDESLWYAPDVLDGIRAARVRHDLGSHGGRHRYFDTLSPAEADEELAYARAIHDAHHLAFTSFVFPRNKLGSAALLANYGIRVYRGTDHAWHERLRGTNEWLGRAANLADKILPLAPEVVRPEAGPAGLVNLPGSLLLLGRNGVRRLASPAIMERKLQAGLDRATREQATFHLWFHPSNFWYDGEVQFGIFERFLAAVAERREAGGLTVRTMAGHA